MPVITPRAPPTPGSAAPGNLYADLATRTLWLGVDPAVDPAQAVLVSDFLGTLDLIADAVDEANAYTDTAVATRALVSHTHTSSQITDFTSAVQTVVGAMPQVNWITGMIVIWSGLLTDIGVGDLAGWALCDGNNGTPNLTDRFIVGAGNAKLPDAKNAMDAKAVTTVDGAHAHTINGTTLTVAQIPAHGHGAGTLAGSGTAAAAGQHAHSYVTAGNINGFGNPQIDVNSFHDAVTLNTGQAGQHTHPVTVDVTGNTANAGGGGSHTHIEQTAGSHDHDLTSLALREAIPYYALAYIMKL